MRLLAIGDIGLLEGWPEGEECRGMDSGCSFLDIVTEKERSLPGDVFALLGMIVERDVVSFTVVLILPFTASPNPHAITHLR